MQAFFAALKSAEVHRLCLPRELGGLNAPLALYFLIAEMVARGDVSAMTHFSFHGGMAMAMLAYSIHEGTTDFDVAAGRIAKTRFGEYIEEIARGDAWGCMDITEPDAGSDMARLRARATQDAEGNWTVSGEKIFITSGHGKFHFVIARTEDPKSDDAFSGLQGLSMFLVKAYDDLPDGRRVRHVSIERLEEKLGHHGSVTAALLFDNAPAQLIGKRGEGFKYMLVLMNNARVGVAFESIGLGECALRMAREYAAGRRSMGKAIADHEMIADLLDEMETDLLGLRALAATSAFHEEMSQKMALLERFTAGAPEAERVKAELPKHRRSPGGTPRCSSTSRRRRPWRSRGATCRSTGASGTPGSTARRSSCETRWCCPSTRAPARSSR
jgi:alkylation response protein AidB-like acyl-CoA dehydrogenase